MRIVADENCDQMIVAALREAGHDILSIRESRRAASDDLIFDLAHIENRAVLTGDLDFGLLAEREARRPQAVILMRLDGLGRAARARRLVQVLAAVGAIENHLLIVEPTRVRIRAVK